MMCTLTSQGFQYLIGEMDSKNQRFDHLGCVRQVIYRGKPYLSREKHPVLPENRGTGICSEFTASNPVGFQEAKVGERFLKIGCGALKKTDDEPYSFQKSYEMIPLNVSCEIKENFIRFSAEQTEVNGYAYIYEKIFQAKANRLDILHRLYNTGQKPFVWQSYAHNFYKADLRTPETIRLYFKQLQLQKLNHINGRNILKEEQDFYRIAEAVQDSSFYTTDFQAEPSCGYELYFSGSERRIQETVDFVPVKFKIWMAENCICPELFLQGSAEPGTCVSWKRTYTFY